MNKQEIVQLTEEKFQSLFDFLEMHDDNKWDVGPLGKWTTGQHIIHLTQSAKPLNRALRLPFFILWYKFGKANRPPRMYEQIIEKYQNKLKEVGKVVSPFSKNMPETPPSSKKKIIDELRKQKEILIKAINGISEKKLDTYLIPHPLMGRMLIREILMWNAYHVEHHHTTLLAKH